MRGVRSFPRRLFDLGFNGVDANLAALITRSLLGLAASFTAALWLLATGYRHTGVWRYPVTTVTFLLLAFTFLYLGMGRPALARVRSRREELVGERVVVAAESERHRFLAELQDAFDMTDTEDDSRALVARALGSVHAGPGELLLADSSRAHLTRAAVSEHGAAGCGVSVPAQCPAVRRGTSIHFPSSTALGSCPRLADRGPGRSALCAPVTILGTPMSVVHVTDPEGTVHSQAERTRLESLAAQAGARIGALRATAASHLAASTDSLSGLLNRRSGTDELQQLAVHSRPYAVAFADLDSFKALNDTFGHATGDHALRLFARTLTGAIRSGDSACRYGGEEFLVLFADCDVAGAAPVVHRIRQALAAATADVNAGTPTFTASFGLADSTYADDPIEVIALADTALLQAKREGKDRLLIADRPFGHLETPRAHDPLDSAVPDHTTGPG